MRIPRYLISGLHFTTACTLLLCFLVPRRAGAFRQRSSPHLRSFTDVTFAADRERLNAHMRQYTRSYCTCANAVLQARFCKHDFAIVARRTSAEPRPFHGAVCDNLGNFAGTILPLEVKQVLRGPLEANKIVDFHFIQGSACGVTASMIPRENETFLITGFHHLSSCDTTHHQTEERLQTTQLFLVTRCSASQPLDTLSNTQIAGLFLGLYNCDKKSCREPRPFFWTPPKQNPEEPSCFYPYYGTQCYSKYTVCIQTPLTPHGCSIRSVNRLPKLESVSATIPPELHATVLIASSSNVTDEQRFYACLQYAAV